MSRSFIVRIGVTVVLASPVCPAFSQTPPPAPPSAAQPAAQQPAQHDHAAMSGSGWSFMHDGVLFGTYSNLSSRRPVSTTGGDGRQEFRAQNWWMTMGTRPLWGGTLTVTTMLSLEPATVTKQGYAEIFQAGETYNGKPLVDYQHPHDFLMQLSAMWRRPFNGNRAGFTIAAAPVGEATLGPVAFMHRQSGAENPIAPLGHHTFDSTHIAMGVVAAGVDAGPLAVEGSVFHGREPDEGRWDLMDPGPLDSWATRVWLRPSADLEFQASYGHLRRPERTETQDVNRTTVSGAWTRMRGDDYTALFAAFGRNDRDYSESSAFLVEATQRFKGNVLYGRYEWVEVESEHLLFPGFVHAPHRGERIDPLKTFTIGGLRDIATFAGFELGVGGDVQFYEVPPLLRRAYYRQDPEKLDGRRPISFHIFFRLRPPVSAMGRMFGHVMTQPMRHAM